MLTKKSLGVALACAMALGAWSGTALANPVSVGGVMWDTDSPLDLNIQALNFRETSVANVGDVLHGYGKIGSFNGASESTFCPSCDLVFTFTYTLANTSGGTNPNIVFDSGNIQFYVAADHSFNVLNPSTAMGTPWLTLTGHTFESTDSVFAGLPGELFAHVVGSGGNPQAGSNGFGLLDATGGVAMPYMDTNTIAAGGTYGFADFSLNSSFLTDLAGICGSDGTGGTPCYPISGTGELLGDSMAVPEPGEAGLLGLGLAVLGFFIRRRRKEAEGE